MTTNIVVGGGIAGLISALYLSKQGLDVVLIEKENTMGGLLRSKKFGDFYYENGTHILQKVGFQELDNFLFSEISNHPNWNKSSKLNVGVFFNGNLDDEGPCINTNYLNQSIYNSGLVDLINAISYPQSYSNLQEQLKWKYGETFANTAFIPTIEKLFGVNAHELIVDSYQLFMSPRIKIADKLVTEELKKIEYFDARIAYHKNRSENESYYPSQGGVKIWVDSIIKKAKESGVKIITEDMIDSVSVYERKIKAVHLKNRNIEVKCERLIWSVPSRILYSILGNKIICVPEIRKIKLFHLRFDRAFKSNSMYILNYDPSYSIFRVTLYDSLTGDSSYRCTVEVIYSNECNLTIEDIIIELKNMKVVESKAIVREVYSESITQGFPVLSHKYVNEELNITQRIENDFDNVYLLGRKVGQAFFMKDVMKEAYLKSKEICDLQLS